VRIARGSDLYFGEKDRLVKRTVTIIACFVAISMVADWLRADSMPVSAGGSSNSPIAPLGFWTYGTTAATGNGPLVAGALVIGGTETDSSVVTIAASDENGISLTGPMVLTLTGTGQITGLGSPLTNLTWRPDELIISPVLEPTTITWTASAPGAYTITSTILPNKNSSNPSFAAASSLGGAGGSSSDTGTGPFSQTVSFNSGDSVSFVAGGQGSSSGGPLVVSFGDPAPVPEPSSWVAILGLAGTSLLGLTWMNRGRFRCSASSRPGE
jgi:hypothetical protein